MPSFTREDTAKALSFHHVCEAIVSSMIALHHIPSEHNPAKQHPEQALEPPTDLASKQLSRQPTMHLACSSFRGDVATLCLPG